MVRQRKPFSKIEPEFMLGESPAGLRFLELSEVHQLYYVRLWNYCIRCRTLKISNSPEIQKKIAGNIFITSVKFRRFLEEIQNKKLAVKLEDDSLILKGIKEIHSQLLWTHEE